MSNNHQSPKIGACGDNCGECPRFKATLSDSDDELQSVAKLWFDLGLRDTIVTPGEIACDGCHPENRCAYQEQRDCAFHSGFQNCGYCPEYPCDISENTLRISSVTCQKTEGLLEFKSIHMAFFRKKENLEKVRFAVGEEMLAATHDIRIVQLDRLHLDEIKILWEALNNHHLKKSTYFKDHFSTFTFEARVAKLQIKNRLTIFVAFYGEEKLGYSMATTDEDAGEVDSLFVIKAHRGKNVGQVLFLKAIDWLRDQGCGLINIAIAEGNEMAISFYERFGFMKRFTVMQKRVDP